MTFTVSSTTIIQTAVLALIIIFSYCFGYAKGRVSGLYGGFALTSEILDRFGFEFDIKEGGIVGEIEEEEHE